jgi:uncharacterized membrane-anchored protein
MSRRALLLALAIVGAIQLAVPLWMIAGYERTLARGTAWRFEVAPVDPADAFRGRYLALRFAAEGEAVPAGEAIDRCGWAFASLVERGGGLAQLETLHPAPPAEGDYLRLRASSVHTGPQGRQAWVDLPFDRLYLPEGLAPAAERRLRDSLGDPDASVRAWAVVRVRAGRGVLEDLVLDGVSARRR